MQIHFDKPARRWYNTIAGSDCSAFGQADLFNALGVGAPGAFLLFFSNELQKQLSGNESISNSAVLIRLKNVVVFT